MALNLKEYHDQLLFVPLGGSNEIGMNLNLYHYQGKWLMVDLGIGFADEYLPGVDIIVPDIEFVQDIRDDLLGLVLTHAHEDHLGAVPYLWDDIGCDIYATPFTASVLKAKLAGEGMQGRVPIKEIPTGSQLKLGPFDLDLIPLTHSIPEMQALAIKTDKGVVMHTGDWKLDAEPMVGEVSDETSLKKYGDAGILAMVCDSTNVFVEGESGSEGTVRKHLKEQIAACKERVIVTTFASNIARVESIILCAQECGRKVALAGRSLHRVTGAAKDAGYLQDVDPFISDKDVANLPRDEVLILCTGGQGEERAALSRMVQGSHPTLKLASGDTVIFSTRVIPGNENRLRWLTNQLVRKEINMITDKDAPIHVSGHPARAELERMYQLVRPQIAIPVHGETQHIHEHARFAKNMQVPQVVEAFNGAVINLSGGDDVRVVEVADSGYIAIDGDSMIETNSPVIRMRRRLRDEGNITVSVVLDKDGGLLCRPQISAPGSLDADGDEALIVDLQDAVSNAIERLGKRAKMNALKDKIRTAIRKTITRELRKRPVIEVHIHHV